MPPDQSISSLYNTYIAVRHGHSIANQHNLIVSHPSNGIPEFGLSEQGIINVYHQSKKALADQLITPCSIILSSPFRRTFETACVIAIILNKETRHIIFHPALQERNFGDLELSSDENYQRVWKEDSLNPQHQKWGVETVVSVQKRIINLIHYCEKRWQEKTICLVSHGDVLQIAQCCFLDKNPANHRDLPPIKTSEFRVLNS